MDENFKELAYRFGLNFDISSSKKWKPNVFNLYPKLHGKVKGLDIQMYNIVRGSGKSQAIYIAVDIFVGNSSSHTLRIFHEDFFRKFGKILGLQKDIEINDSEFDGQYIVRSDNAEFAKTILSDLVLKNKLIEEKQLFNNAVLKFENGILHYEGINNLYNKKEIDKMEARVKLAVLMAETIQAKSRENYV
jgi:RNA recognition motif-containing protein